MIYTNPLLFVVLCLLQYYSFKLAGTAGGSGHRDQMGGKQVAIKLTQLLRKVSLSSMMGTKTTAICLPC